MQIFVGLTLGIIFLSISLAGAEEMIQTGELLTLERSIGIALKKHPDILASRGAVAADEARKKQGEAGYWPQIDAAAGYGRTRTASSSGAEKGLFPETSHSFEQYSTTVIAKQMLFDFGKTSTQVNIQKQNVEASMADLVNTEDRIILNTKQAYYKLLRTKRNRDVSEETVKQYQQHLSQAKAFFEAGTKPRFDVTKAEVDLSNARLNLIRAENAVRLAVVSLNNAMGVPDAPEYVLQDSLSFQKYEIKQEETIRRAYANRPELKSLKAKKKASEEAVSFADRGYFPVLTGNASWSWTGERFAIGDGWNAGLTLSVPIFSGFLTKNQVAEAKANLNVINANEEALRQNVLFEVQQNFLELVEAEERIVVAELTVRLATENYEIASGRYTTGVGNPIEVTDAEVALSNAKTSYIQALYDYKVASASLDKAMGNR